VTSIAAIILASDSSIRLDSPKQLVDLEGTPLLERVVGDVLTWPVEAVVVVLGASAEAILETVDFGEATVAIDEAWQDGLASSLRVGLDVLARESHWESAFVAQGDQPGIPHAVPDGLIAAAAETQRPAVVPVYRYERGNPVLFDRSLWPRLMTLSGDDGVAALLTTHPEWVEEVRFGDLPPRDVATADDIDDLALEIRRGTDRAPNH
jgi:molybdenum cofactor cytidylyltransferase